MTFSVSSNRAYLLNIKKKSSWNWIYAGFRWRLVTQNNIHNYILNLYTWSWPNIMLFIIYSRILVYEQNWQWDNISLKGNKYHKTNKKMNAWLVLNNEDLAVSLKTEMLTHENFCVNKTNMGWECKFLRRNSINYTFILFHDPIFPFHNYIFIICCLFLNITINGLNSKIQEI